MVAGMESRLLTQSYPTQDGQSHPTAHILQLPIGALPSHPGTNLLRQRRERQRRIALYPLTNSPKYLCGEVTTRNQHENRLPKTASRVPQKMWGMISFYKGGGTIASLPLR